MLFNVHSMFCIKKHPIDKFTGFQWQNSEGFTGFLCVIASLTRLLFLLSSVLIVLLLPISVILFPSTSLVVLFVVLVPVCFVSLGFVSSGLVVGALLMLSQPCGILFLSLCAMNQIWAHFLVIWSPTYLDLLFLFNYSCFCVLMLDYLQRFWSVI